MLYKTFRDAITVTFLFITNSTTLIVHFWHFRRLDKYFFFIFGVGDATTLAMSAKIIHDGEWYHLGWFMYLLCPKHSGIYPKTMYLMYTLQISNQ